MGIKYGFVRTGSRALVELDARSCRKAADHKMVLSIDDDYRPVVLLEDVPNLMGRRGIRGDEESPSNEHTLIDHVYADDCRGGG